MTTPHTPESDSALTERMRDDLRALLNHVDMETCVHESTHRGGAIWTICDDCGMEWADDRGGFIPHTDAAEVAQARATLAAATARLAASEGAACCSAAGTFACTCNAFKSPPAEAAKVGDLPNNIDELIADYEMEAIRHGIASQPAKVDAARDKLRAAIAALQRPSDKLTDEQVAQHVIDLVGPLCDRGTFEAPDWAIACLHAAVNWDKPEGIGKLATTPPQPSPSIDEGKAQWDEVARILGADGDCVDSVIAAAKRAMQPSPSADVRHQTQTGEHIATLESMLLDDHGWIPGIGERVALRWAIAVLRQSSACAESRREDFGWPHWRDM